MRASSAVAVAILLTSTAIPALAQSLGGTGGAGGGGGGGPGGASSFTTAGQGGSNGLAGSAGGGGGGAGFPAGAGGLGAGPAGGAFGNSPSANGSAGGASSGGGGGAGGTNGGGGLITTTSSNTGADTGGNGGNGGAGGTTGSGGGGGGGGAGGAGVVIGATGITYTNGGGQTIAGGNGGNGGAASVAGNSAGNGGGGGAGVVFFNASGSTLNNAGTITGGNGGAAGATSGGAAAGAIGLGGQGVVGNDITIINSGTISAGLNGDGVTPVDAIQFTSGSNTLTLQTGSVINGNIEIDGNGSVTFNQSTAQTLSNVITGVGGSIIQSGSGTLTLSGANTYTGGTVINIATLAIANNSALGTGSLEINGGTLQAGAAGLNVANTITIATNGANFDTNGNNLTISGSIQNFASPPGLFTKLGSGTLTLSAANSYSGGTEVERGTLALSGAGTLGATTANITVTSDGVNPPGILDLGGTTQTLNGGLFLQNGATVQNGALSSSGTFNLQSGTVSAVLAGSGAATVSTGTVTLSGANTYTGATTISSGTLALSGAGSVASSSGVTDNGTFDISAASGGAPIKSLAGSGTVALGANSLTLTNASGTFSGVIGGTGGVALSGGSETLSGANTYTGGTTVSGGTLTITGTLGAPSNALTVSGGTLDLGGTTQTENGGLTMTGGTILHGTLSSSGTFNLQGGMVSAVLAGTGGVSVSGGTATLSGVNIYTGATTIASGGTLALSGAGSIATSSGLADNGTFDISAASGGISIKTLSGSGAVKLGANALTLTNASGTFSGVISGTGGMTLAAGAETLSGANTYTGTTTINAGVLTVLGSLAGPVTVAGGKLNGTGSVGAINVTGGTLAPGDAIGTMHANGNVTLGSGTTFAAEVSPTAADELVASGNVSIGGNTTLAITQDAGTYSAHDYTLISAASVSGTFTTVTGATFTGLNSTIQYSANAVDLILSTPSASSPPAGSAPSTTFLFGTFGQTPNQAAAGNAVTAGPSSAALYTTLGGVLTAGPSTTPATLAQLSGDIHASLRSALVQDGKIIRDTVINHAIAASDSVTAWAAGFGAYGSIDSDGNAAAVHHNDSGVIVGADAPVADGLNLGGAVALTSQKVNLAGESASASGHADHVIAYANWTDQAWVASLGGDLGWGANQVLRHITAFPETDSDHQSNRLTQVFGEVGYRIPEDMFDLLALEPYLNLANVGVRTGAFAETGGVAALKGTGKSASMNYLTLGLRAAAPEWSMGDFAMVPNLNLGWQHALTRFLPSQTLTFAETGESFTVLGVPLDRDAATIQAALDIRLSPAATFSIGYDGEISNRVQNNAIRGELSWKF